MKRQLLLLALTGLACGTALTVVDEKKPGKKFSQAIIEKTELTSTYIKRLQALATLIVYKTEAIVATGARGKQAVTTELIIDNYLTEKHSRLIGVPEELDLELQAAVTGLSATDKNYDAKKLELLKSKYAQVLEILPKDKRFFYDTQMPLPATLQ